MSLVLLDRDGVINDDSGTYVKRPSEWRPIPGSMEAIARLNRAGRKVVVCSNQAGVARGLLTKDDLDLIHDEMRAALATAGGHLDGVFCCTHAPEDRCACRKPAPGLLVGAMAKMQMSPTQTVFIGDSLRDIQAALAARCTPVLVRTGHGAESEPTVRDIGVEQIFDDLAAAIDWLLDR